MAGRAPRFELFNTESHALRSRYVDQAYRIGVWLPFSYGSEPNRRYPTLYVPDAEFVFAAACGILPTLIGPAVPEMLVVGVAYEGIGSWGEFGVLRERDMLPPSIQSTPGENRFEGYQRFWLEELLPYIESRYPADPAERGILGFSAGGFYVLQMLLARPGAFRRHVAVSGSWPGVAEYLLSHRAELPPEHPPSELYLGAGEADMEQAEGMAALIAALAGTPGLHLAHETIPGEGHSAGMIAASLLRGLPAVYAQRASG
ncbi:MAG: alpha/beta hydrolase-fold protein [Anaerolineae bacterium]